MPRTLRLNTGAAATRPRPIKTCPAAGGVDDYRNETYLLRVDETFREFFGLTEARGYFCYAAVGIAEKEYKFFKRALTPIFAEYESCVVGSSGLSLREFEFDEFRRLERPQWEAIAAQIGKLMKTYGCFFVGFYTHTAGVIMERVRSNFAGSEKRSPGAGILRRFLYVRADILGQGE